jgi:hypothetical protein
MDRITSNRAHRHTQRRMIQVERILRMADLISRKHFGITTEDLRRELEEAGDSVCSRTITRYLSLFTDLGHVSREVVYVNGARVTRYRSMKKLPRTITGA